MWLRFPHLLFDAGVSAEGGVQSCLNAIESATSPLVVAVSPPPSLAIKKKRKKSLVFYSCMSAVVSEVMPIASSASALASPQVGVANSSLLASASTAVTDTGCAPCPGRPSLCLGFSQGKVSERGVYGEEMF